MGPPILGTTLSSIMIALIWVLPRTSTVSSRGNTKGYIYFYCSSILVKICSLLTLENRENEKHEFGSEFGNVFGSLFGNVVRLEMCPK